MLDLRVLQAVLLLASLFAALLRFEELRRGRLSNGWARLSGTIVYLAGSALVWGLCAWLLQGPLDWFARLGLVARILLGGLGFGIGWVGLSDVALGGSLVYGLWHPNAVLWLWWVAPVLLGYILGWVRRRSHAPRSTEQAATALRSAVLLRARRWLQALRLRGNGLTPADNKDLLRARRWLQALRRGDIVRPPERADRLWHLFAILHGSLPLLMALTLTLWTADPRVAGLRMLCGLLVSINCWLYDFAIRGMTRYVRRGLRLNVIATFWVLLVVAASPLGTWVVTTWVRTAAVYAVGGLLLVVLSLFIRLILRDILPQFEPQRAVTQPNAVLAWAHWLVLRRGLFLFFLIGVFYPDVWLLANVALLAVIELVFACLEAFRPQLDSARLLDANYLIGFSWVQRQEIWGNWLYDALSAHPTRPDLSLIHDLLALAMLTAHGSTGRSRLLQIAGVPQPSPTAQEAQRWIAMADEGLDLVETALLPHWPAQHHDALSRALGRGRAHSALVKAIVFQYLNLREEALAAWRDAAVDFEHLGQQSLAVSCRISAASLMVGMLGQPVEAARELAPILSDANVHPVLVRQALNVAVLGAVMRGDLDEAVALRARHNGIQVRRSDVQALLREGNLVPGRFTSARHLYRGMTTVLQQQEAPVAMLFGEAPLDVRALPPGLDFRPRALMLHGMALLGSGRRAAALPALDEAAIIAERDGYFTWAYSARLFLAIALQDEDVLGAYQNLLRALSAQAEIRGQVIEPELRIKVAGYYTDAYDLIVRLLVSSVHFERRGWPARPVATAFDFMEQARSRVLLELLGERVTFASRAQTDLLTQEQGAYSAYQRELVALDTVPAAERQVALGRLRMTRKALERVWSQLEHTGLGGAEYTHLRQGSPRSFDEIKALLAG